MKRPRARAARALRSPGALDVTTPARPVALELIGGRGHYERVKRGGDGPARAVAERITFTE